MSTEAARTLPPDVRLGAIFRSISLAGGVLVFVVGALTLVGWAYDIALIKRPFLDGLLMKPNTAVACVAAGVSLWFALMPSTAASRRLGQATAALVLLIGVLTLIQDLTGWTLGIDELLMPRSAGASADAVAGRMAVNTAVALMLMGVALWQLQRSPGDRPHRSDIPAVLAGTIALVGLLGHAYGQSTLYRIADFAQMALITAGTCFVLALCILFARPSIGLMAVVTGPGPVGLMLRRQIPVALFGPPLVGWLGLWFERRGLYDAAFGAVLVSMANMTILGGIGWVTVRALTRTHRERERISKELVKAERLQSAIFNSANFSSIATDAKGVIQLFNVGAERMLGFTAAEVMNQVTPADMSDPEELITRAQALSLELDTPIAPGFEALAFKAARGIEDIYELTYIRKDHSSFPAIVSVTALRDVENEIIGYLLIGTDNTARKQAEAALIKAGALQNAIFHSANFSSIATDAKGVIQIFNVGAERMLGYTAAEVVDRITPADISDEEEVIARARKLSIELDTPIAPGFEALAFKAARGIEDIYELTYIRKDGIRIPAVVSVTALRDATMTIIGYLLIGTDNTARKQIEAERLKLDQRLRDQHFYTRSLIESNIDALMTTDPRGIITDLNKQAEALTGCTRDELLGSPFRDHFTDADRAGSAISLVLDEARITNYELTAQARDGTLTVVSCNAATFFDRDRQLQGVFASARDVTALKQVERELQQKNTELEDAGRALEAQFRQANKMDAIGQLAAGVAHDFNNLLTVILGFSELMSADTTLSAAHMRDLEEIIMASRRASGLTKQLLAFSRQQSLSTTPLDVNALVTDMSGMLGRLIGEHITITVELAPTLPLVLADRGQLEQVVMNLVVNARDAMPDGGCVTITSSAEVLGPTEIGDDVVIAGSYVRLDVADTGTGMGPDTQAHLFEPFFTTKGIGRGTGLGLSTVAGIIRHSKGHIRVDSQLGRGTAFTIFLPTADHLDNIIPVEVIPTTARLSAPSAVLLVDDDEGVRRLATRVLSGAGYRVFEASSGSEAERLFAQHSEIIDLLVTDVIMPLCSGPDLLRRLQQHKPNLLVVFMSGHLSAYQRSVIDADLPFVQKPFVAAQFVKQVQDALTQKTI